MQKILLNFTKKRKYCIEKVKIKYKDRAQNATNDTNGTLPNHIRIIFKNKE
jgi:hypothetical protein